MNQIELKCLGKGNTQGNKLINSCHPNPTIVSPQGQLWYLSKKKLLISAQQYSDCEKEFTNCPQNLNSHTFPFHRLIRVH